MSKLYYSDSGRTVRFLNEELSSQRHARKRFVLPNRSSCKGALYIYCCCRSGCDYSLKVNVNGHGFVIEPDGIGFMHWVSLPLEAAHLGLGNNIVELWSDNIAMDGWMLGVDGCVPNLCSELSLDGGGSWRNKFMGIHHCLQGEYVIRLRFEDETLCDSAPPEMIWPDVNSSVFKALTGLIPLAIQNIEDQWEKMRMLASWVSGQFPYRNLDQGVEYAPWDPLTILSWGKHERGQTEKVPVTMCVHYGVFFCAAAMALGVPARNVCCTNDLNGSTGHFISEVWIEKWRKWCQVDANCDLIYVKDNIPLSVAELFKEGLALKELAVEGESFVQQPEYVHRFVDECLLTGRSFRFWAVWLHNDYCEHPKYRPPSHGVGAYAETDWIWAQSAEGAPPGMFPYSMDQDMLQKMPPFFFKKRR
jgi:hypothetical protein